jgi:hypothetical protein
VLLKFVGLVSKMSFCFREEIIPNMDCQELHAERQVMSLFWLGG